MGPAIKPVTNRYLVQVEGHPEVYLIENGMKCHYTSPEALLWNGRSFSDVTNITSETLQSYPDGQDISISQAIIDKYNALGGAPIFGAPDGKGELNGDKNSAGTYCSYVNFEKGVIECFANGPEPNVGKAYAIFNPFYTKELERNNLRNAFFNSNEIMEQRVESFKYSVKIESSYFAAGTKWASMGYAKSVLGYPIDNMSEEQTSKFGTKFRYQNFANGTESGALEYNISSGNVFAVHGAIFAKWGTLGYVQSDLGLPIMDQEDRSGHWYCEFEGGNISWNVSVGDYKVNLNSENSAITVGQNATTPEITQKFIEACNRNGGLSVLGNPTTKVHYVFGFEVQDFPEMPETAGGVIMYNSSNNTAYFIHGAIWDKYYAYPDANKTRLGHIASDEKVAAIQSGKTTGNYTKFETGTIHWISDRTGENVDNAYRGQSFVTYGALDDVYTKMGGTYSDLGFPIMDQNM